MKILRSPFDSNSFIANVIAFLEANGTVWLGPRISTPAPQGKLEAAGQGRDIWYCLEMCKSRSTVGKYITTTTGLAGVSATPLYGHNIYIVTHLCSARVLIAHFLGCLLVA